MAFCKDPSLTYLNENGYNVVRLPRVGLEPLDVLGRDGSLERLGRLPQIWSTTADAPVPEAPRVVGNVNGRQSDNLDLSVGLKLLANVLAGMGSAAGLPSLSVGYTRARKVQFTFTNVHSVSVDPFAIGSYLRSGDLDLANPFVRRYFGEKDTREYVVFEVLKSDSVKVTAKKDANTKVGVDFPAIQNAVGVNVQLALSGEAESEVTYQGSEMLTFGFKVFELVYEDGAWRVEGVKPSGEFAFADADDEERPSPIVLGGNLLVVKDGTGGA